MNSDVKDIEKFQLPLLTNFLCTLEFLILKATKLPECDSENITDTQYKTRNNLQQLKNLPSNNTAKI